MINNALRKTFVITQILIFSATYAADLLGADPEAAFDMVTVPGGQCADGSAYHMYIRQGDPQKVLVHFQGGGACWDVTTCFGPVPFTRLKDQGIKRGAVFHSSLENNLPFKDYTYVFLPYCTGDIYVGSHTTQYSGQKINHMGRSNVERALGLLENDHDRLISHSSKLVVYGESAGALGAILNMDQIDPLSAKVPDRTVIFDSPGLHFSWLIWNRFDKEYLDDLKVAMKRNGLTFDMYSGVMASQMKKYCEQFPRWKQGFIQSTQDIVMSVLFGMRSQDSHRKQVLGLWGLDRQLAAKKDPCSSFIPDAGKHVWALDSAGWNSQTNDKKILADYVRELVDGRLQDEYLSHK